jgi:integrase
MKGSTFKRCSCTDPTTGRRLGRSCPKLGRASGGWSRSHGLWYWQIDLPATVDGRRRTLRHGTYPNQSDADTVLDAVRAALAVPDATDATSLRACGDLIETAVKSGAPVPNPDTVRRVLHLDLAPTELPTMADYLARWLDGRRTIKRGTRRSYEAHIRLHLIPHLGKVRIDRLRPGHISAMYDAIDECNDTITTLRASKNPRKRLRVKGQRVVGVATQHRIHATLRKALNDAVVRDKLVAANPAVNVELTPVKRPKAMIWTDQRVATWRESGKLPSPVMVWTPEQVGRFLDHTHDADDRLYALYHVVVFTGLRRGEACGLHWDDLDLDAATLTVRWQLVQHGWATAMDTPKTDDSEDTIPIDAETVAVLRSHRIRQRRERLAAGKAWTRTGLVFTTPAGTALHPADVTDHFRHLAQQAGLPPVRLHDLRHGHATMALAAGVQLKVISGRLRHASTSTTDMFYAHILPELARTASEATAAVVPRHRKAS